VHLAQVPHRVHDVAGAGLPFRPDHGRSLADPAERLSQVAASAYERNREVVLVDVVLLVGGCEDLGLVDEVDLERLQHTRLGQVADPALRHHRDRHGLLDFPDLGDRRHARDSPVAPDVGRHSLQSHHRRRSGGFRDLRLLRVDDVHDHAALEHLG
jgi:hypothetical protein